ncbi:hypothetical protein D3C71_1095830 [compost metagenome]
MGSALLLQEGRPFHQRLQLLAFGGHLARIAGGRVDLLAQHVGGGLAVVQDLLPGQGQQHHGGGGHQQVPAPHRVAQRVAL